VSRPRVLLGILAALIALDLVCALVTGPSSGLGPARPWAFGAELVFLGLTLFGSWRLAPRRPGRTGRFFLALLLLPTLLQFQFAGGRLKGDGVMYYVYVRSLMKDHDLDLTNEYAHYGLLSRGDLAVPTKTGLRRSIFAIGPAVASVPFFLVGEGFARLEQAFGWDADLSGYGPTHRNAVALGALLYGFLAVLLIHDLLLRRFSSGIALGGALLIWLATFLYWYMVQEPTMSHSFSTAAAAMVLWLWDRDRGSRTAWGHFCLGLAAGVAICIRWQNGVLLVLPAFDLLQGLRDKRKGTALLLFLLLAAGVLIGAFPQMAAWKAIYGDWILTYPPHGRDFLRLSHPFFLNTFFSSRHGLLSWTPVLWGGYLGFFLFLRREPRTAIPLLVPLVLMTYVNVCSGDWWAGGSFSNRRFDSLLPILALGLGAFLEWASAALERHPGLALPALCLPFMGWNLLLVEQVQKNLVPRDDTVFFPTLVGNAAQLFSDRFGSPTTWPASLLFALQEHRPASQYDLLVGRYLFYRQNNLGGHVPLGLSGDEAFLGEGWGPRDLREGLPGRALLGRARLLLPLDEAEALELRFQVAAFSPGQEVRLAVNGHPVGSFWASPGWSAVRIGTGPEVWRREINDLVLETSSGDLLLGPLDVAPIVRER
jgi:hypothetical protein